MGGRTDLRPFTANPKKGLQRKGAPKIRLDGFLIGFMGNELTKFQFDLYEYFFWDGGRKNSGFVLGTGAALDGH